MISFWQNVRDELDYCGLSQKELTKAIDISYNTLRTWLNTNRLPDAAQAVKIAKVLHTSVEYLVTGTDEKIKPDNRRTIALLEQAIENLK